MRPGPKRTQKEYQQDVLRKLGSDYQVVSNFTGVIYPIKLKHLQCGNTYWTRAMNPLRGHGCPICSHRKLNSKLIDGGRERFLKRIQPEYKLLTEYQGCDKKVELKAQSCGHCFWTVPQRFTGKYRRCPVCHGNYGKPVYINNSGFGLWMKQKRVSLGMSIVKLSALSGIQTSRLSRIEHGRIEATIEDQSRIRHYLK